MMSHRCCESRHRWDIIVTAGRCQPSEAYPPTARAWLHPGHVAGRPLTIDCMVSQLMSPPAPIDATALAESLRPFGQSRMLPRAAYIDPAVFEWEQEHFFGGGWLCVGRSEQVANPGDQRAEPTGAGSVLLTRDDDRVLHAFANTCRHRGHELLPCGASASHGVIICPYHAWTYGLNGKLR